MYIPIIKPYFTEAEEQAVIDTLRSGWIVQGAKVSEFEQQIASFVGIKYAVATSSCTTALHLALLLSNVGPGDEVIVPSLSFIATANSVLYAGATPIFADIDERTYNIDPLDVAKKITKKTKAIIAVHQIGLCADIDRIKDVAEGTVPIIIEDAACALGATYKGKNAGTLGDLGCFSFHPRKAITTGEGGMITTNNKAWATRAKVLRAHGMSISDRDRHKAKRVVIEEYHELGFNYRMTDLQAAIGLTQFLKFPKIVKVRKRLANTYTQSFKNHPHIIPPYIPPGYEHSFQSYQIRLQNCRFSRNQIMQKLLDHGISTRPGVMAIHETDYYRKRFGKISLPKTSHTTRHTLILPLYPQMKEIEQEYVIDNLLKIIK